MERWVGRVALVTGASSGIGYGVTKALVQRGMKVVACVRNIAAIQKLKEELSDHSSSVTAMKCDVSKEEDVSAMFERIREDSGLGRVDVCINNAGLAHNSPLLTGDPAQWKQMFDVNVLGLMMVTREAFQLMREKNIDDGHIILINSIFGKAVPNASYSHCYSATKFSVSAIGQGIRHELREMKSTIRITQVSPGLVETEIASRILGAEKAAALYSSLTCLQPRDIADSILYILGTPSHVEINDIIVRPTEQKH